MSSEILTPVLPESVADGTVIAWNKKVGDAVKMDDILVEIETDKVVLEVPAMDDGVLSEILVEEGAVVTSSQLLGRVEAGAVAAAPAAEEAPATETATAGSAGEAKTSPAVRKALAENDLSKEEVQGSGKDGRILKEDVAAAVEQQAAPAPAAQAPSAPVAAAPAPVAPPAVHTGEGDRGESREPMSRLRTRIAERLLEATQTTAMLTTFNEVDMKPLMDMRKEYKEMFEKQHDARLGFMSLFVKASTIALQRFPEINAFIDGNEIVYHNYCDIGIAVSSKRGLVVPVLRNTENMSMADIESTIAGYGQKAQAGKLDMS
ncbi:MAG: 2-oxo acid dehydrogenase subunit E2, partial [Thiolinea sp.]